MFNGWPASYSDIAANLTFRRTHTASICTEIEKHKALFIMVLGASGTGKSTLAKQVIYSLSQSNYKTWEHKTDHTLLADQWRQVAKTLKERN
ncbi:hypothetical protein CAY98_34375, partial [Pseudomonas aeruginosa]